jgi:7-cyano-7-deazaguanine synthase
LAEWILADRLPVRFQLQLHKVLWGDTSPANERAPGRRRLLSGGLDSATVLAIAVARGFAAYALSVRYGQRHSASWRRPTCRREPRRARASRHGVDLAGIGGSALTDSRLAVPESPTTGIPITYVPARNTLLLSLALGWAEVLAPRIFSSASMRSIIRAIRTAGPEFIEAFERLARLATKAGVEGGRFTIHAPLIDMSKADIIRTGLGSESTFGHGFLLPGRFGGRLRQMRFLPDAGRGFCRGRGADPTRYA